jgi:hypothetical protein
MRNILIISLIFILSSCAPTIDVQECIPPPIDSYVHGFWGGLVHGFVLFFSLFGSLFTDSIAIYAVNNSGGWYDIGFVLGTGTLTKGIKEIFD